MKISKRQVIQAIGTQNILIGHQAGVAGRAKLREYQRNKIGQVCADGLHGFKVGILKQNVKYSRYLLTPTSLRSSTLSPQAERG
jgi:hypothetical protein